MQVNPSASIATSAYVYAQGRIEPRFPRLSVEKEYAQVTGRAETAGLTDRQALQTVLSQPENRYLARQLCYVLTIEGLDTYILQPGDPGDLQILIESLRPTPQPGDVDVVVGRRGRIAPPEYCNGLMVPIVIFDQIYSFDRESFIKSIPRQVVGAINKRSACLARRRQAGNLGHFTRELPRSSLFEITLVDPVVC